MDPMFIKVTLCAAPARHSPEIIIQPSGIKYQVGVRDARNCLLIILPFIAPKAGYPFGNE